LTFRGVDVGAVSEIRAVYDHSTGEVSVPVLVELRPGGLMTTEGAAGTTDTMAGLIARGLRARLDVQSLLTGQLLIALDFFPPPVGAPTGPPPKGVIPSVPSTLANLQRTVDRALMGAPEIADSLQELVASLRDLLSDGNRAGLNAAIASLATLAQSLGDPQGPAQRTLTELPALVAELRSGAGKVPPLLDRLDSLAASGDARLAAIGDQTTELTASLRKVSDQAALMLGENRKGLNDFVEEGLPEIQGFVEDATLLVNELSATVRDLRQDPARFFLGDRAGQGVVLE
jgi:paraquat-inducible protein B